MFRAWVQNSLGQTDRAGEGHTMGFAAKSASESSALRRFGTNGWFRYDKRAEQDVFKQTANSVLPLLEHTEKMFDNFERIHKLGE